MQRTLQSRVLMTAALLPATLSDQRFMADAGLHPGDTAVDRVVGARLICCKFAFILSCLWSYCPAWCYIADADLHPGNTAVNGVNGGRLVCYKLDIMGETCIGKALPTVVSSPFALS